jgi:hypothetical protein
MVRQAAVEILAEEQTNPPVGREQLMSLCPNCVIEAREAIIQRQERCQRPY